MTDDDITIDWYVGTYSGLWKAWKGREGGVTVTYTETIDIDDVMQTVTLTKSQRLTTSTIQQQKQKYCNRTTTNIAEFVLPTSTLTQKHRDTNAPP